LITIAKGDDLKEKICERLELLSGHPTSNEIEVNTMISPEFEKDVHPDYPYLYKEIVQVELVIRAVASRPVVMRVDVPKSRNWNLRDLLNGVLSVGYVEERFCEDCDRKTRALMQQTFWLLPELLIVHIARFRDDGRKIDRLVEFPSVLDTEEFVKSRPAFKYRLFGVVYHLGGSIHEGHFLADILHYENKTWYTISDNYVVKRDGERPVQHAYVLFYEKVKGDEVGLVGEECFETVHKN
jgi:hypothetical protein